MWGLVALDQMVDYAAEKFGYLPPATVSYFRDLLGHHGVQGHISVGNLPGLRLALLVLLSTLNSTVDAPHRMSSDRNCRRRHTR